MSTIQLSESIYRLLRRRALQQAESPDQLAETLLREHLLPQHAYVETVDRTSGPRAVIRDTGIPISIIVSYLHMGETPESLVERVLPQLTLAQVYDGLSYYHERRYEIDREIAENTEEYGRTYLREHLGTQEYARIPGQAK